jgi:signal transduction histidine kinase
VSTAIRGEEPFAAGPGGAADDSMIDAAARLAREELGSLDGTRPAVELAVRRARSLARGGVEVLAPVILLSELVSQLSRGGMDDEHLRSLVSSTAELTGMPRDALGLQVAQAAIAGRTLLELPPQAALDRALGILLVATPTRHVSLWQAVEDGTPGCVAHAGQCPSKRTAELARRALDRNAGAQWTGLLLGIPLTPGATLIARPQPGGRGRCDAFLRQLAPAIAGLLERRLHAEQAATTERVLVEECERRLTRLAFDVHDGPLQNVAGIAGDLRRLRQRLHGAVSDAQGRAELLGCVNDLDARLRAVDTELRDISHSFESPTATTVPFPQMLEAEVEAFKRRTDIRPGIEVRGDFGGMTESQRIALWRIVQESLTNAREHSGARELLVTAVATDERLLLEVTDDGRGFNVPGTLVEAARRGRLGLVGVCERVRLLGGRCDVRSAPGGPTTISVALPRWQPQT